LWVRDREVAAEGNACVKAWHDGRFIQRLTVKAGQPVTVRCLVRGEPVVDLSTLKAGH
jgi:hypothetical protein